MQKKIKIISIITYLILLFLMLYFKIFPTIINSGVTNFLIIISMFSFFTLIVYGALNLKSTNEIYLILPQSLIFSFVVRAIPNLRFSYPPLQDPYYYLTVTQNILQYGSLTPFLSELYPNIVTYLHWPIMNITSVALNEVANWSLMQIFRFQEPLLGILFFLAVFILTRTVAKKDGIALIAALFASFSGPLIFYQSEFHAQGVAFIFFTFFLYFYIKSKSVNRMIFTGLLFIIILAFAFSHNFSSLFMGLFSLFFIMVLFIISEIPNFNNPNLKKISIDAKEILGKDMNLFLTFGVILISYHVMAYFTFVKESFDTIRSAVPSAALITLGQNIPILFSFLNSTKWMLIALAIFSLIYIYKKYDKNELRLAILFLCTISAGLVGTFIVKSPTDRLIGFYMPFVSIFAAISVNMLYESDYSFKLSLHNHPFHFNTNKNQILKIALILSVSSIILTTGVLNSQSPSYFFKDTSPNNFYWYSNMIPEMSQYKSTGEWIESYVIKGFTFNTEFDSRVTPFYFGKVNYDNIYYYDTKIGANSLGDGNFTIINPWITKREKTSYVNQNKIYSSGEVEIYSQFNI